MISERSFAKGYSSFWNELLPGSSSYVRLINTGLKDSVYAPIEKKDIPGRRALVNGISFEVFREVIKGRIEFDNVKGIDLKEKILEEIVEKELKFLKRIDYAGEYDKGMGINEISIIKEMSRRLILQFRRYKDLVFYPKFKGCGIIFEVTGDLMYLDTLAEIKAGERNFSILDLRQLFIYGALNHAMVESKQINKFHLFNPRTGIVWLENVDTVAENLSGSGINYVYSEIINYVSEVKYSI